MSQRGNINESKTKKKERNKKHRGQNHGALMLFVRCSQVQNVRTSESSISSLSPPTKKKFFFTVFFQKKIYKQLIYLYTTLHLTLGFDLSSLSKMYITKHYSQII
jgi:hypothetical protein